VHRAACRRQPLVQTPLLAEPLQHWLPLVVLTPPARHEQMPVEHLPAQQVASVEQVKLSW
jgi:hypothetical protein